MPRPPLDPETRRWPVPPPLLQTYAGFWIRFGAWFSAFQSIGRFFGYLLSIWVLCLGLIWVGLDTYKQGWHDMLAHTYVLRQQRS